MNKIQRLITPFLILLFISFIAFSHENNNKSDVKRVQAPKKIQTVKKQRVVGVLPLGNFNKNLITIIKANINTYYQVKVIELTMQALPQAAYIPSRQRYSADDLLDFILKHQAFKPNTPASQNCDYIVGLTEKDICTPMNNSSSWGVFGLGLMPGKACVISTLRLKKNVSFSLQTTRLIKVVLHELGHNFGLDHCKTPGCMMRDAEGTIKSVDNENMDICNACKAKLKK